VNLYELVYVSLATDDMSADELRALADDARQRNARRGVTGLLFHHRREFVQLLEGPKAAVRDRYETIFRDPRHGQLHLLWEGDIGQRSFGSWPLVLIAPGMPELAELQTPAPGSALDLAGTGRVRGRGAAASFSTGRRFLANVLDEAIGRA
jgi:hypothetical protein